ncbi:MAG: hypothetical protein HC944_03670 [Nanoarchaeota archaeon]|nr:hypothetical protein [Nanoarchaeota archaeon]
MHTAIGAKGPSQFSHAYKKLHGKFEETKLFSDLFSYLGETDNWWE